MAKATQQDRNVHGMDRLETLAETHVHDVLRWAYDTFNGHPWFEPGDPFEPSFQQIAMLTSWSHLLNAKRKVHWNQCHPSDQVTLSHEEDAVKEKIGMSMMSGHGLAKTTTISLIALHFLQCLEGSRIMVTAPAGPQLFTVIWPELYKWINTNPLTRSLWKWNAKQIYPADQTVGGEHWIRPRTIDPKATAEEQGEALAGMHGTFSLRCLDESSGIPDPVMLPFEGGLTDPVALIVMGFNPTRNVGFAIETQRKFRDRWLCCHLDGEMLAMDPPSWYNPKSQKDLVETYGRESNFYRVRVRGLPPQSSADTLFPWDWVMAAAEREIETNDYDPIVIGVDIGGQDEDADLCVAYIRQRDAFLDMKERRCIDTMTAAFWVERLIEEYSAAFPDSTILTGIDSIGVGKGVSDYLIVVKGYQRVYRVNVSIGLPRTDRYFTVRDQAYWQLREKFEEGLISIPKHDRLIAELTAFRWSEDNPEGRIKVEAKPKMKTRLPPGQNSPDHSDALMISERVLRMFGKRSIVQAHEDHYDRKAQARYRRISNWKVV